MSDPDFKHRNAYTINHEDNSAEFDLYDIAGNVVDTFLVDLEDVSYIADYKWCKSQYGVENHKVKNLARFIAARYIKDLKPTQSVIRIDGQKLDYRKRNLRIGVTGSSSKDSTSRLNTDARKCEKRGEYLHVYFAEKSNGTKYYRAMVASNNITVGKFCVVKSYNLREFERAREYAIYTAYLFEKEYYGNRIGDREYARKEKAYSVLTQIERDKIASDVEPQLSELTRLRALVDKHLESTSLLTIANKGDLNGGGEGERSKNDHVDDRYHLPCSGRTLRAAKEAARRGKYMHLIESYKTRKSSPHYVAGLNLTFVPKVFKVAFSIDAYDHAKEMAIYAAYLMEKVAYGDNFPKSEYDRKLEQISKLTTEEALAVNDASAGKLETIYELVNNRMRERELKKKQLDEAMAEDYERIKSGVEELAYGEHNRLKFHQPRRNSTSEYLHVGATKQFERDSRRYAEVRVIQKGVKFITRTGFLTRTYGVNTKLLAIYAAYLMEKTVYGTSIPGGEYEAKMLEILKLTRDDMFMVEKRVLPKLEQLLDAVNAVCENDSKPAPIPELEPEPEQGFISEDGIVLQADECLNHIKNRA